MTHPVENPMYFWLDVIRHQHTVETEGSRSARCIAYRRQGADWGLSPAKAKAMQIQEFKDWLFALDIRTLGQPPDLAQWRELKARLEAVTGVVASSSDAASSAPAITAQSSPLPGAEPEVEDLRPIDPEPGDFTALSRLKDGGLAALAVEVLKGRRAA